MLEDGTLEGSLEAYDPDGDMITFYSGCPPKKGTLAVDGTPSLDNAPFYYEPFPDESGFDSFVFMVSDGQAVSYGMVRPFPLDCWLTRIIFFRVKLFLL
jgi:hypothetical protein